MIVFDCVLSRAMEAIFERSLQKFRFINCCATPENDANDFSGNVQNTLHDVQRTLYALQSALKIVPEGLSGDLRNMEDSAVRMRALQKFRELSTAIA